MRSNEGNPVCNNTSFLYLLINLTITSCFDWEKYNREEVEDSLISPDPHVPIIINLIFIIINWWRFASDIYFTMIYWKLIKSVLLTKKKKLNSMIEADIPKAL